MRMYMFVRDFYTNILPVLFKKNVPKVTFFERLVFSFYRFLPSHNAKSVTTIDVSVVVSAA